MNTIKDSLHSEILEELKSFKDLELGDEKYKIAVDGLTKLLDKAIEIKKIENTVQQHEEDHDLEKSKNELEKEKFELEKEKFEFTKQDQEEDHNLEKSKNELEKEKLELEKDKFKLMKRDTDIKQEQVKDNKTDQLFRNSIAVASIVIPSIITIWGTVKTLKFEETGTVTTMMGRGFINKLIPKK